MDIEAVEALSRAASALEAASEAIVADPGERPGLCGMMALWLAEEAERARDAVEGASG
ncbi:hypothetical protein [Adlercreutzia muris]|uniref:hypothetical protein n=1 Tax=Adlercreutzia muris TaxID=1796610 RepID=UPI0014785E4C|nr:hypothetical protein [Adlercreutzia muris]MCR2027705.1 hypothetical protein [Adlercreutzia muris]